MIAENKAPVDAFDCSFFDHRFVLLRCRKSGAFGNAVAAQETEAEIKLLNLSACLFSDHCLGGLFESAADQDDFHSFACQFLCM